VEEAMMVRLLAIAALAVGLAGPAVAQGNAPERTRQQIEAFMREWMDAYNRGDSTTMKSLTTADSFGVGDRGVISGSERFERAVENEASLGAKVTSMDVDQVRMLGRNAAVAAGSYSVTYNSPQNPQALTIEGTWMQVLERQRGGWRSVAASYTPFNPPPPSAAGASNPQPSAGTSTPYAPNR
jgi:ketosteroid isomerase-like protein